MKTTNTLKIATWDLGATKCQAALVEYNRSSNKFKVLSQARSRLSDFKSLDELIENLQAQIGGPMSNADAVVIAAAGQYDGEVIQLQKGFPFPMEIAKAAKRHNWQNYTVVHDYTPIVCSTFISDLQTDEHIITLRKGNQIKNARRLAAGIGTGLGVKDGVLFSRGQFWLGKNEFGHIGLPLPQLINDDEWQFHRDFMMFLRKQNKIGVERPLSLESVLSGRGFARIYQFMTGADHPLSAEEAAKIMSAEEKSRATALFAWYLGILVSTLELTFMPAGGIWLTGGVIQRHLDFFDNPAFERGLNITTAYFEERQQFPLHVMKGFYHADLGSAYYGVHRLLADRLSHY